MEVSSNPKNPSAIAEVGDYAVRQNTSDRSNAVLNESMDADFKPVHGQWSLAWTTQQNRELELRKSVTRRKEADHALDGSIGRVLRAIRYSQGDDSTLLKEYVPGGNLDEARRPLSLQLSTLAPYAERIAHAPDSVIPVETRCDFADKYGKAQQALSDAEKAGRDADQARIDREQLEPGWAGAYARYHRKVEHELEDNVTRIEGFILRFPKG